MEKRRSQIKLVYNFNKGPFVDDTGIPFVECLIETTEGLMEDRELYMPDVDSCFAIEKYFKANFNPLTLDELCELIE